MRDHFASMLCPCALGLFVTTLAPAPAVAHRVAERPYVFTIRFHVVAGPTRPVADDEWMRSRVEAANRALRPTRVSFGFERVAAPSTVHYDVQSAPERDALQPLVVDGVVNVFVVKELRSYGADRSLIRGVHWHRTGHRRERGEHYIIIANYAAQYVLAHEIGHFFGNPRHSRVRGNLMSYMRGDGVPSLDATQVRRVRRAAARYVRTGELVRRP